MRLLYVCNGSNFLGAGGMEYHLIDVATQLKDYGVDIGFVVRKDTYLHKILLAGEPDVFPMTCTGFRKPISSFQLLKAIISFKPDIISINRERDIVHTYLIAKLYGFLFRKDLQQVAVFHNLGWRFPFNLKRLNGIIFPNRYIQKEYLVESLFDQKNKVIYHGINIDNFHFKNNAELNRKRKYFTGLNDPIIGMVGEFRKNQLELVDVAVALRKKLDRFTFAVVGRGTDSEIELLKNKIRSNNLDDYFVVTGNVSRDRMPDVFYDFDVSVTTNRYEPFGIVFIESLASYTPLVAYNSGGPVEILANGGGCLIEGDPEDMAEKIFQVISDVDFRCRLGNDARRSAEKLFSIQSMGKQHYQFYLELNDI